MISSKFDILKSDILNLKIMDTGHSNVQKVHGKNEIVDKDGQVYVGINDKSNNFYIRAVKSSTFGLISKGAVKRYKVTTPCEIVCTMRNVDVFKFAAAVVPIISKAGIIKSINTDSAEIYIKETGDKSPKIDFRNWQIVKIEFKVVYIANSIANCLTDLCKC